MYRTLHVSLKTVRSIVFEHQYKYCKSDGQMKHWPYFLVSRSLGKGLLNGKRIKYQGEGPENGCL